LAKLSGGTVLGASVLFIGKGRCRNMASGWSITLGFDVCTCSMRPAILGPIRTASPRSATMTALTTSSSAIPSTSIIGITRVLGVCYSIS